MQDVPATLSTTRPVAFAMWWKIVIVMGAWLLVSRFVIGFLGMVVPLGQLGFWLATLITNMFGERAATYLWGSPAAQTALHVLALAAGSLIDLALLLLTLNWLLANHVGRDFGGVRLLLQRSAPRSADAPQG
jgi:hypothetical protein